MQPGQGMVSFSLMSNPHPRRLPNTPHPPTPRPCTLPPGGNTPLVWGNKSSAVSPGLQASMLLLWDLAALGQTGSPGPGPADTHNWCPPQSMGIKKSFGVKTTGLSMSFFSSKQPHTVNFACFHISPIKLHSLEPCHSVQHIVATVINIGLLSGITDHSVRSRLRSLVWNGAHRWKSFSWWHFCVYFRSPLHWIFTLRRWA